MWAEELNARGGLLGRSVEIKIYDDQSDPSTSAKLYERLIERDKVDLLFSAFASSVVFAGSSVTEKHKFPMVAQGASAQKIWQRGYRYIFQIFPQPEGQLVGLLEVAKKAGLKTIAVATEDSTYTKELAEIFVEMAKKQGFDVVFYEEYGKKPADLSPLILKMKAKKPDMIFGATYLPESVLLMRHAKELNFNPKLYAFTIGPALDDFVTSLGTDSELVTGTSLWESTSLNPGSQEFVKNYEKKYNSTPPYQTAAAYGGMQILEAAVKKAGSLDREKIRDALQEVEMMTIFGGYKVNEKGAQIGRHAYVFQIRDGKRKVIWPENVKEADLLAPTPQWSNR
jgi:branched-chain amino acid transport system substrate-binding protein